MKEEKKEKVVLYAVLEKDFEYNDEIYTPHGGGKPLKLFFDKAKAEKLVVEKTIEELKKYLADRYGTFIPFESSYETKTFKYNRMVKAVFSKYDLDADHIESFQDLKDYAKKLVDKLPEMDSIDVDILFLNLENPLYQVYEIEVAED